jgi:hypothetical protein
MMSSESKSERSVVVTPSLNPRATYSVRINNTIGAATALYTNTDEDVCRITMSVTASRISSNSSLANATGTLKFIIFAGKKPLAVVPVLLSIPENSLIFTISKLGHSESILITAESDAEGDNNLAVVVTVGSFAPTYVVDCCHHKGR